MSFRYRKFVIFPFTCHFVSESARNSVGSIISLLFSFCVIVARDRFRVLLISIPYRLIRELCNKGKLATMCRNWDGFVPMLPASDRFWLGCGALWHMCGRENIGVIVLVFRISRYFNSLFRISYHVISFSVYAYAAVYPCLSQKAPDNAYPYRHTVGLHCAVAQCDVIILLVCAIWRRFTSIVCHITECGTETE